MTDHSHDHSHDHGHGPATGSANPVLVEIIRGDMIESRHRGSVAIVDSHGQVEMAIGDVLSPVFARSGIKPIQALALVETGAAKAFSLGLAQIALACSSHNGATILCSVWFQQKVIVGNEGMRNLQRQVHVPEPQLPRRIKLARDELILKLVIERWQAAAVEQPPSNLFPEFN